MENRNKNHIGPFHSVEDELTTAFKEQIIKAAKESPRKLAFMDTEFMLRRELRPVRLQLELLRPEIILEDHGIVDALVVFGSSKIPSPDIAKKAFDEAEKYFTEHPQDAEAQRKLRKATRVLANSAYLKEATRLAEIASSSEYGPLHVFTGGGPSFMEAANLGAKLAGVPSVTLQMILPGEFATNPHITPELTFLFHYFSIRKMHFLMRAKALAAFPGGFGTFDELFEVLTLMQTHKIRRIPLLLFHKKFWENTVNFEGLVEEGTILEKDLSLINYVETADEAWEYIKNFYRLGKK